MPKPFPPGGISSTRPRTSSPWREFAFWLHEVQRAIEPWLPLACALDHWSQISVGLMESPRKRKTQAQKYYNKTS